MRLSVIIPVHNAGPFLDRCLENVRRSSFRDYEGIAVNDASTDQSQNIARTHGATLVALDQNGGPARARDRGAERPRGEILL
jgi:glycosyltransferase involved in cell wall biosynthesis